MKRRRIVLSDIFYLTGCKLAPASDKLIINYR